MRGRPIWLAAAALVFAAFAVFGRTYSFAVGNQIEHLPSILRILDPNAFPTDWYVQSTEFTPRAYYFAGLAWLTSRLAPLEVVCFTLFFVNTAAVMWITLRAAKDWYGGWAPGLCACAFISSFAGIQLGEATFLTYTELDQSTLSLPWALATIWLCTRSRLLMAVVTSVTAAAVHPVLGTLGAVIAFGGALLSRFPRLPSGWAYGVLGLAATALTVFLAYYRQLPAELADDDFFRVGIYLRNPHHYVPTHMAKADWAAFVAFLCGVAGLFAAKNPRNPVRGSGRLFLPYACVAAVLLLIGYLGVEQWSFRPVASLQTFRSVAFVKWFGFVVFGAALGSWLTGAAPYGRWKAGLLLLQSGRSQPYTLGLAGVMEFLSARLHSRAVVTTAGLIISLLCLVLLIARHEWRETVIFVLSLGYAGLMLRMSKRLGLAVSALLVGVFLAGAGIRSSLPVFRDSIRLTLDELPVNSSGAAAWAGEHTAEDSLFLTPPAGGAFRLRSRRSVVFDWKSFPHGQNASLEWERRLKTVYGNPTRSGYAARRELDRQYRRISDSHLAEIAEQFGPQYALLYAETATGYAVVYEDPVFKIVKL